MKIPRRSGWSFERTERFDFINESNNRTMVYRFSSFDPFSISFFFFLLFFFLSRRNRHLFTTRHAPSSTSLPIDLKIIIARRSRGKGGLEEREVNIWTDLIASRLKARGASHPFIELVCRVKPQKAIKSIGDPFPLFLARLETTKDSRDQNPRCSTLFSSLARMRERSMEIVECAPRQFISLCISKCNKQHGGGPLPYAHVRYPG